MGTFNKLRESSVPTYQAPLTRYGTAVFRWGANPATTRRRALPLGGALVREATAPLTMRLGGPRRPVSQTKGGIEPFFFIFYIILPSHAERLQNKKIPNQLALTQPQSIRPY